MSSRHRKRHKHNIWYRMRRWIRHNKGLAGASVAVFLLAVAAGGVFLSQTVRQQNDRTITAGNSIDMKDGYRSMTHQGKEYRYNTLITTILYAGIDSKGKIGTNGSYGTAARADSISLVVLDKKNKKMSIVALNRDTMTEIRRYTLSGTDRGTYVSHLGYAYTYGDGGEVSCENLQEAVSSLFGGIPITDYAVTNQDSMTYINNLVDGVTLEVPNDDLAALYPKLQKGAVVTLDEATVTDFLQYRDTSQDFSNEGRTERQQAYVTAYISKIKEKLSADLEGTWTELEQMDDYLQTSITKNKYIGLANLLEQTSFTDADYYRPEGEDREGDLHDEFYIDEDALQQLIIDLFYEEI